MRTVCKWFVLMVLMLSLSCSFFSSASAENGQFWLTDAQAGENRHFTVELKSTGVEDIVAFTAVLEYDPEMIVFRGTKTTDERVQCSAYCFEEGKVNLVYLCNEGVNANSEISSVFIEFRSLSSGESAIELYVTDAVDSDGQDVKDFVSSGCALTVNERANTVNSVRQPRTERTERPSRTDATSEIHDETYDETNDEAVKDSKGTRRTKYSKDPVQTNGDFVSEKTVALIIYAGIVLVIATAFIAYKAGTKVQEKRNFSAMKLISDEIKDRKNTDTKERNKDEEIT